MCILSTLSALNSIENYYYHIEFRMDSMHIGTQALISTHNQHMHDKSLITYVTKVGLSPGGKHPISQHFNTGQQAQNN